MTPTTPVEVLTEARSLLLEKGWCQGEQVNDEGQHCVLGAMNTALGLPHIGIAGYLHHHPIGAPAMECLRSVVMGEGWSTVFGFNDNAASLNDVVGAIDEAILLAKEAEAR